MKKRNVFAYFFLPVFFLLAFTLFLDSFNNYKISLSAQNPMSIDTTFPPAKSKTDCTGKKLDCLFKCLMEEETGGVKDPYNEFHKDTNGLISYGPYQIQQPYVNDASLYNSQLKGVLASNLVTSGAAKYTADQIKHLSREIMEAYFGKYMTANKDRLALTWTCEMLAGLHNGGPSGYNSKSTQGYRDRINECMKKCLNETVVVTDAQAEI